MNFNMLNPSPNFSTDISRIGSAVLQVLPRLHGYGAGVQLQHQLLELQRHQRIAQTAQLHQPRTGSESHRE